MPFVIDSGAAASSLIGELEAEGVHVIPINMRQYGQACGSFYDAYKTALFHTWETYAYSTQSKAQQNAN